MFGLSVKWCIVTEVRHGKKDYSHEQLTTGRPAQTTGKPYQNKINLPMAQKLVNKNIATLILSKILFH